MDLGIDRQALVPVVQQIVSAVAEWIRKEGVSPGTRLPSIRQLALDNLLSQSSVIEAFERLVAQGLLAPRHGSGLWWRHPRRSTKTIGMKVRNKAGVHLPIARWAS